MDLKSAYPYRAVKNDVMYAYPRLNADPSRNVVVFGAVITGALFADELPVDGHHVVVLDQRDICWSQRNDAPSNT